MRAQLGEQLLVGLGDRGGELLGHGLAGLLEADLLATPRPGRPARGSRCSSGWPASIVSSPALSFSQIRGTAKNQLGAPRAGTARISRGFGQQVTCEAVDDRAGSGGRRARRCAPPAATRSRARRAGNWIDLLDRR